MPITDTTKADKRSGEGKRIMSGTVGLIHGELRLLFLLAALVGVIRCSPAMAVVLTDWLSIFEPETRRDDDVRLYAHRGAAGAAG